MFSTPAKLYVYETLLERLPPDLQDVAAALGPCIQGEHTIEARKSSPCGGRGHPRLCALGCGMAVPRRDGDVCTPPLWPNTPAARECKAAHGRLAGCLPGVLRQCLTAHRPR
jgi:hypothetical protein